MRRLVIISTLICLVVGLCMPVSGAAAGPSEAAARIGGATVRLENAAARMALLDGTRLPVGDARARVAAVLADLDVEVAAAHIEASSALAEVLAGSAPVLLGGVSAAMPSLAIYLDQAGVSDPAPVLRMLRAWSAFGVASRRAEVARQRLAVAFPVASVVRMCPLAGPHRFDDTWGVDRPWGRTHKGADVFAAAGAELAAIETGTVVQSGWHWAGGFGVYLLGAVSGDVYYYAHLRAIAPDIGPGARVAAGDLMGWVGATGNADTPHLHFGWIPDHGPGWMSLDGLADPYPLLRSACG